MDYISWLEISECHWIRNWHFDLFGMLKCRFAPKLSRHHTMTIILSLAFGELPCLLIETSTRIKDSFL